MKITRTEANELDHLYKLANEGTSEKLWDDVKRFYNKLGEKYNFDVTKVAISKFGMVMDLQKCFRCGTTATTVEGTTYVRENDKNEAICYTCYGRYYPEKAFREEFQI
jgi:hypothetical protein